MTLPLVFRRAAEAEYEAAVAWYEEQAGLRADLANEVQRVLVEITLQPARYPIVVRNIREAAIARFPYCIY